MLSQGPGAICNLWPSHSLCDGPLTAPLPLANQMLMCAPAAQPRTAEPFLGRLPTELCACAHHGYFPSSFSQVPARRDEHGRVRRLQQAHIHALVEPLLVAQLVRVVARVHARRRWAADVHAPPGLQPHPWISSLDTGAEGGAAGSVTMNFFMVIKCLMAKISGRCPSRLLQASHRFEESFPPAARC